MSKGLEQGIIGRTYEDELPVIFKLVDDFPPADTRAGLPWLAVVSWRYDGSARNGMPTEATNQGMIALERAVETATQSVDLVRHAYSRTGNGLKELVYYVSDQDAFMAAFNAALAGHPRYPIEVGFFRDPEWDDFGKLLQAFRRSS